MHAMAPRLAHLSLDHPHPATSPSTPTHTSPYRSCAASASISASSMHANPISSPPAPYHVSHHGASLHALGHGQPRSPSPSIVSPVPSSAVAEPSLLHKALSGHAPSDSPVTPPPPTPRPPEHVVTTNTIEHSRDDQNRPMINQYVLKARLGKGQHGEVFLAVDKNKNDMPVAIKICQRKNKKEDRMEMLRKRNQPGFPRSVGGFNNHYARPPFVDQIASHEKKILKEIAIMKKCQHGQIVQLYEVINDRMSARIMLVMEYMGGGEVKWRDKDNRPCLQVDQIRRICCDVVLGLNYLHHQGIIHRDIKPANLLWTDDRKNVKITDFGVSYFSTADRMSALRQNPAWKQLVAQRKEERQRQEEEQSKKRLSAWRGRGKDSRDDIKGKSRALDIDYSSSFPPSSGASSLVLSSTPSTPVASSEDARLEAAVMKELEGELDPYLIDEGGLSRQAGTPSFFAPELVWEYHPVYLSALQKLTESKSGICTFTSSEPGLDSKGRDGGDMDKAPASEDVMLQANMLTKTVTSHELDQSAETAHPLDGEEPTMPDPDPSSFRDPNAEIAHAHTTAEDELALMPRPPITKAIDVWALGVTLYCLLFGRTPFSGSNEFIIFSNIHTQDFVVDKNMGYDHIPIPSGSRHPSPDDQSEGAIVIRLLDRLLEKDCSKRITLEEVKCLPWMTRNILNPAAWLAETAPEVTDPIHISRRDEEVAVSSVKFAWRFRDYIPRLRLRALVPGRSARSARSLTQAQKRAEQDRLEAEADRIVQSAVSDHDGAGTPRLTSRRRTRKEAEKPELRRASSRSKRVVDAFESSVRHMGRAESGTETPRRRKRRTVPNILHDPRDQSFSRSRENSRSRPTSIASGRRTPRFANGSRSNLTSPSTTGFTSEGESDYLDFDDTQSNQAERSRKGSEAGLNVRNQQQLWEKERRRNAFTRHSLSNFSKMLSWRPKSSPQGSISESSSFGAGGHTHSAWMHVSHGQGSSRSPTTNPASPVTSRSRVASGERLSRRSADEMGGNARTMQHLSEYRSGHQRLSSKRTGSGPVIGFHHDANEGPVANIGRGLELASEAELIRAASWGDVARDYGTDYGFGGSPAQGAYDDADESDYGGGTGYGRGNFVYGDGVGFGSGDVDEYSLNEDARLVGAGGILSHPVSGPSSPNSVTGLSASGPSDGVSSLQGMLETADPVSGIVTLVPGTSPSAALLAIQTQEVAGRRRGASIGSRQHPHQQVISSPLAQTPLNLDHESKDDLFDQSYSLDHDDDPTQHEGDHEDDGDDASSYRHHLRRLRSGKRASVQGSGAGDESSGSGIRVYGQGHQSFTVDDEVPDSGSNNTHGYDDDDVEEGSESSEGEPPRLEVKRRRPSEITRSLSRTRCELIASHRLDSSEHDEAIIDVDSGTESDAGGD